MSISIGTVRTVMLLAAMTAAVFTASQELCGQRFFWDSASSFPGNLTRLEYENLTELRKMPDFQALQRAYAGNFEHLERWLSAFGLRDESVAELLVGMDGGGHDFAIAKGEFYPLVPTELPSSQRRLAPVKIGVLDAYCEASGGQGKACAVFKGQSWAAIGTKQFLNYRITSGDSVTEPLPSDPTLTDLVAMMPSDAPLWGIARGGAALTWLRGSLPFADSLPIVWQTMIDGLDGLSYSVVPGENQVRITVNLEYKNSDHASFVGAILKGIKTIDEVLWVRGHGGGSSPFSNARVEVEDRTVSVDLSAPYQDLVGGVPLGTQGRP